MSSFFPTPVSAFIDFLNGKTVSSYDDSNKHLLSVLSSLLYSGLRRRYDHFLSGLQQRKESESIRDIDIVNFLIGAFPSRADMSRPGPIQTALTGLSDTCHDVLLVWLTGYRMSELDTLRNPSSQAPPFGIFSRSSVRTLLYPFLEDSCEFPNDIDDEDVAQKCTEIRDSILGDLMEYLKRLSIAEANTQPQIQGELDNSATGREVVSGGQNQQDATTQDIEHSEWFLAWEDEFRGSALENLEVKLLLNVQALQTAVKEKVGMSRIIPIVQSSGTGKSRLAEQYASNRVLC